MGNCVSSNVVVDPGLDPDVGVRPRLRLGRGRLLAEQGVACGSSARLLQAPECCWVVLMPAIRRLTQ